MRTEQAKARRIRVEERALLDSRDGHHHGRRLRLVGVLGLLALVGLLLGSEVRLQDPALDWRCVRCESTRRHALAMRCFEYVGE